MRKILLVLYFELRVFIHKVVGRPLTRSHEILE